MGKQPTYPQQPGQGPYGGYPPGPGGPQYMPSPPQKKRHWIRNISIGIIALVVVIITASALSSGGGVSTTPSGTSGGAKSSPSSVPATHQATTAGIGSYFDVTDSSGDHYRVTLVKVVDPAQGADQFTTPDNGKRFVGAVFTIKALSGSPRNEDANLNAALVGSNGQTYTADLSAIAGYTDFSNGEIKVAQGDTTTGAVNFQVPSGVKVSKVQWTDSGFGSTVQWNVR
jgi:hypothetical protein